MNGHLYDSSSNIHDINKLLENEMVNNKKNVFKKWGDIHIKKK